MTFTVGDTARLKSGGPLMTIEEIKPEGITCTWFDDKNKLQKCLLKPVVLEADDGSFHVS